MTDIPSDPKGQHNGRACLEFKQNMNPQKASEKKNGATGWDFGIEVLKFLWNITDRGYLVPIIILIFVLILAVISIRMPPEDISPNIRLFFDVFGSRIVLVLIFVSIIVPIVCMWRYSVRFYRGECERLGKEKSYWVHAPPIETHSPSGYQWGNDGSSSCPPLEDCGRPDKKEGA